MALRIPVYTGLLYQDLVKSGEVRRGARLPPVFPVVLYNGEGKWTARRDVAELIEPVVGLTTYRPRQRHLVLDEGRIGAEVLDGLDSTLAEFVRLERSPEPRALREIVSRLNVRLRHRRHDSLRRALVVWLHRVVLKRLVPGENVPEVNDMQEIDAMLAERVVQWT